MHSVRATILQAPTPHDLEVLEDHVIDIGDDGTIVTVTPASPDHEVDHRLPPEQVLIPGLIDTHLHAPQWPQLGTGLDLPLDQWLFERTFPLEARYHDEQFARTIWADMVPTLLAQGTTTAVYYGSIHVPATVALAEQCLQSGQRAFVGRVAMDHPEGTPDFYRDPSANRSVEDSAHSVDLIHGLDDPHRLVRPIVTPRFIPACTDDALRGHAELAEATGTLVQTHCSEGDWEHGHVLERCGTTDTLALAERGLLRDHAVLAHATHLDDTDRQAIRTSGAGLAHCPLSNAYFANAVFPLRRNLDAGLRVGLGTDVAGGATSSMLAQCSHTVTMSRLLEDGVDVTRNDGRGVADSRVDVVAALHVATLGGAELLGIDAGLLATGRVFDAVAITLPTELDDTFADDWARRFEKAVRLGAAADIARVWVAGREVAGREGGSARARQR
ncbi:MAG: amidohydrolase family protein [Actinomycetota bacterium]